MILSTGVLRAIASASPTIRLDVLASPLNAPVLRAEPYVREVVVFDRHAPLTYPLAAAGLRSRRYDAVVDCMITAPSVTTLLLMLASGATHRIGVRHGNDFAYTLPVPPRESAVHIIDKLGALVTAFGLQPSAVDLRPSITLTALEREAGERMWRADGERAGTRRTRLLVNVSAGRAFRQWPDDRFVRVVQLVRRRRSGIDVVFIGAPGEHARTEHLSRLADARTAATPEVRDAFAVVAASDVVFTPDTSIAHAATAFRKPAAVMYVRGMSALWGPYGMTGGVIESATGDLNPVTADEAASRVLPLLETTAL
jgi:ADP-heptose:LPS heptosyltransferase